MQHSVPNARSTIYIFVPLSAWRESAISLVVPGVLNQRRFENSNNQEKREKKRVLPRPGAQWQAHIHS